jgi:hypothetical protein
VKNGEIVRKGAGGTKIKPYFKVSTCCTDQSLQLLSIYFDNPSSLCPLIQVPNG